MSADLDADHPDAWAPGLRWALKTLSTKTVGRAAAPDDVLSVCLAHNLRTGNEGHRHRSKIDPARTGNNEVLRGPACPLVAGELARNVLDELGLVPPRRDTIMGLEVVVQAPDGADTPAFWVACMSWFAGRYEHIVSAVVHRDQTRPHMHVIALAIAAGRLAGHALTSGVNRVMAQRRDFMGHIFTSLGFRPNRIAADPLEKLALSAGRGARTATSAAARDAKLTRQTGGDWTRDDVCMAVASAVVHGGSPPETGNRHARGKSQPPILRSRRPAPRTADFWRIPCPPATLTPPPGWGGQSSHADSPPACRKGG